jgi:peptidylamidoglycolate lyase
VYVADRDNNRIQEFDATGKFLKQWKNNKGSQLYSLAIEKKSKELYAIDYLTYFQIIKKGSDILQFDAVMNFKSRFGRSGSYEGPKCRYHDIAVDDEGNIYVGDILKNRIQKFMKSNAK